MTILKLIPRKWIVFLLVFMALGMSAATMMLARRDKPLASTTRIGNPILAFSPDGSLLACSTANKVVLFDSKSLHTRLTFSQQDWNVRELGFTTEGNALALEDIAGRTHLVDVTTGKDTRILPGTIAARPQASLSSDGKFYATNEKFKAAATRNLATGKILKLFSDQSLGMFPAAFSPDGKLLAVAYKNSITIVDPATSVSTHTIAAPMCYFLEFTQDGKYLVSRGGLFGQGMEVRDTTDWKLLQQVRIVDWRWGGLFGSHYAAWSIGDGVETCDLSNGRRNLGLEITTHRQLFNRWFYNLFPRINNLAPAPPIEGMAISQDGKLAAVSLNTSELQVWRMRE